MAKATIRKKSSLSKRLSLFLLDAKRSWLVLFLLGIFSFASGIQATSWLISQIADTYNSKIGWKKSEELALNNIAANMQINAVKQALNSEPLLVKGDEQFTEYTFRRPGGWVQVISDSKGRTLMYSIAICDQSFKPKIMLSTAESIQMNYDTLDSKGSGKTLYSISGATANSYLLEGGGEGNPSNYQAFYLGATDACGSIRAPSNAYDLLINNACKGVRLGLQGRQDKYCQYDVTKTPISKMRKEVKIDTITVTAPFFEITELQGKFNLGPDRIELRVLPQYNQSAAKLVKSIPYYNQD